MLKVLAFLLTFFIISTSAFIISPTHRVVRQRPSAPHLYMDFEDSLGVQPPLGFWDPLGLLKGASQERFDRLRYVELKHGRIAMLAILGHLVTTAGVRWPFDVAFGTPFSQIDTGLAALDFSNPHSLPQQGIVQIILFIGALDLGFTNFAEPDVAASCQKAMDMMNWSPQKQSVKYAIELNNGRAAQMGILGLMVHEKLNNDPYVLNYLLGFPVPFNQ